MAKFKTFYTGSLDEKKYIPNDQDVRDVEIIAKRTNKRVSHSEAMAILKKIVAQHGKVTDELISSELKHVKKSQDV